MSERATGERRLTTILAVDVCGYTALSERDGAGARAAVRTLAARMTEIAGAHQGRVFHAAGDGFLAEFPSATRGVEAAVALHGSLSRAPITAQGGPIRLRAGLHTGEVTVEPNGDLLGHAVNVASRLEGEASPGGTLVSAATRSLSEAGVPTRKVGDLKLKNLRDPVTAYAVLPAQGPLMRLRGLLPPGWARRNRPALLGLAALLAVVALGLLAQEARRQGALRAELAAAARQAEIEAEAERLAATLADEEDRLIDREAVRSATAGLLASDDPRKAGAVERLLADAPLAAALSLRAVLDEQEAAGEPEAARLRTALEVGVLAAGRDQALAQDAYERAYAITPDEPYVLRRLADIAVDRGQREDARVYLDALLAGEASASDQVYAHNQLGHVASFTGDLAEAERRHRLALAIARANDLAREQGWCLRNLGKVAHSRGLYAQARGEPADALFAEAKARFDQALRLARATDDAGLMAVVYNGLGAAARSMGDAAVARDYYERRLVLAEEAANRADIASVALNLADLAHTLGDRGARDAYVGRARRAAETGRIDGMLGYVAITEARFAEADGDGVAACTVLDRDRGVIDWGDAAVREVVSWMEALPCRESILARLEP